MILDNLKNISLYRSLGPRFALALEFLQQVDFASVKEEKTVVLGEEVFAIRVDGPTRPQSESIWEAHRRYADIHCQFGGGELIGYSPLPTLKVTRPYEEADDSIIFSGAGRMIKLEPGEFMIMFPSDGHMPGVADGIHPGSAKIVMKVLLPA